MIIVDEKFNLLEAIVELRHAAIQDITFDDDRTWSYTDCYACGGVKNFLDWMENKVTELMGDKS